MSVKFEPKEFGKQGRGNEGEKFTAQQVVGDSIDRTSLETIVADLMTAVGNDLTAFAEAGILGVNKYLKNVAGGSDEISKLAAFIIKSGNAGLVSPELVGKSKAETTAWLRARQG